MNPKKKFGQNFITDKNLINKIVVEANLEGKNVVEVGPGRGALTSNLCEIANRVVAFEIDKDLSTYLDEIKIKYNNLEVIYGDFLKEDFKTNKTWELIGNLPYYITTPIIFKFLENDYYNSATIMIQKEVAERIASEPNSKKYNALSVIIQYLTNVKKIVSVSRKMFYPIPEVDSVVIQLIKRENRHFKTEEEESFFEFIKAAFTQKRKTLINNLLQAYRIDKQQLIALLSDNDLSETIRSEQIDIETFIKLYEVFKDDYL